MTAEMTSPACLSNSRRGSVLLHIPRGNSGLHAYTCQKPEVIRDSVTVLHLRIYTCVCTCRAIGSFEREIERERATVALCFCRQSHATVRFSNLRLRVSLNMQLVIRKFCSNFCLCTTRQKRFVGFVTRHVE